MCRTFEQWFTKEEYLLFANLSTPSCQDWTWAPVGRGEHCEDGWEVDVAQEEVEREEAQGDQVLAEEKLSIVLGHTVLYDLMKKLSRVIRYCVEYGNLFRTSWFLEQFLTWNGPHPPIYLKMSSKSLITSCSLFFMIFDAYHWWIKSQFFSEIFFRNVWQKGLGGFGTYKLLQSNCIDV